jgi:ribonuclease Z
MDPGATTTLTFLGTDSAVPGLGNDTASFLINGHVQVDCGWAATLRLLQTGEDALAIDHVVFTHLHHDHYLGLPHLLFLRAMRGRRAAGDFRPLTLVGPAQDLARVAHSAWDFVSQAGRFFADTPMPTLVPLDPGSSFVAGELQFDTAPAVHPVQAMSLRVTDTGTGARFGISGDTAFSPALADFFRGVPLLVHECALGAADPPPGGNPSLHASAGDAARIATRAAVGRLYLVHCAAAQADAALRSARALFPATELAEPGQTLVLGRAGSG